MGAPGLITAFASTVARLFTLQASWNGPRMQGIGFGFASAPLIRQGLRARPESDRNQALARAAGYFNSHPFFAGLAAGALARVEADGLPAEQIERLRGVLKGPLGLIGDRLIWTGVLPVSSALGLVGWALGHPVAGILAFLISFNGVHLAIRFWSVPAGWNRGVTVNRALQIRPLRWGLRAATPAALLAGGFALPILAQAVTQRLDAPLRWWTLGVAAVTFVSLRWLVPRLGAVRLGLLGVAVTILAGWIWP